MGNIQQIAGKLDLFDRVVIHGHSHSEEKAVAERVYATSAGCKLNNNTIGGNRISRIGHIAKAPRTGRAVLHGRDVEQSSTAIAWMERHGTKSAMSFVKEVENATVRTKGVCNVEKDGAGAIRFDTVDFDKGADGEI